jgi:ketosteroid isomerase-like protein
MPGRLLLFLLGFVIAVGSRAQGAGEKEVAARVEQLRLAMVNADGKALRDLTAEKLSYGHSSGTIEGREAFVENIVNGKSDFVAIDLNDQSIMISGDVAIVRHKMTGQTNDGGKPGSLKINVLLVWQKQRRQWKLVARQSTKIQ